ncbi:hypothetical protein [Pararhizobium arenae]|uniref:hypothetical protein n=1 Tax=Pararhizobium arenae TaxID=1856850 RepID=UPI00094AEB57|nr:hypothetical protein [Pararhizobium arenae]
MNFIHPPAQHGKYPDRFADLQRELDGPLKNLYSEVCRAGWGRDETLAAIIAVADNIMLAEIGNDAMNKGLKRLR